MELNVVARDIYGIYVGKTFVSFVRHRDEV